MTERSSAFSEITTPHGLARVGNNGRILWAEWEVWRHAAEMVEAGLWRMTTHLAKGHERTAYFISTPAAKAARP
jgi:hypothetical protein